MPKLRQLLTKAQLQILALLLEKLSSEELEELCKWLLGFCYNRLQKTLDKEADEKGWTEMTFEK